MGRQKKESPVLSRAGLEVLALFSRTVPKDTRRLAGRKSGGRGRTVRNLKPTNQITPKIPNKGNWRCHRSRAASTDHWLNGDFTTSMLIPQPLPRYRGSIRHFR